MSTSLGSLPLRIGVARQQYPERRNILGILPEAEYHLSRDMYSIRRRTRAMLGLPWRFDDEFRFKDFDLNRVDLFHFFNHISYGQRPWISTFEWMIPRTAEAHLALQRRELDGHQQRRLQETLRLIALKPCKHLIAISEVAKRMQIRLLDCYPQFKDEILHKLEVIHPPQALAPITTGSPDNAPLRLALVGHDFFRKGGLEVLQAVERLCQSHGELVHLTIVSYLRPNQTATPHTSSDAARVLERIRELDSSVSYYPSLSPRKISELMQTVDVGLLPSYDETYGYTVLEFHAHGVPVITTDIGAFPEVNDSNVGWVLPVGSLRGRTGHWESGFYHGTAEALQNQLLSTIAHIAEHREEVRQRGLLARRRIESRHSPEGYSEKMKQLYLRSMSDS